MPASVTSPSDLVNLSLGKIGYRLRVGATLYEGSRHSIAALTMYAQTRDEVLRHDGKADWGFAERNLDLTASLLKSAPANGYVPPNAWAAAQNPPLPWLYEYSYPADCLKVRILKTAPLLLPNFDPRPSVYSVANDNAYNPPRRVILTNLLSPILVYTGQVTDPTTWPQDFTEEFSDKLARVLAPQLANLDVVKLEAMAEQAAALVGGTEER
jgi:hypothetical protein